VKNPLNKEAVIKAKLTLPEGFEGETDFEAKAAPKESISFVTKLSASKAPVRRARIACDITVDRRRYGEQAEMLVTVK
jgi:hypothetical protein